MFSLKPPSPLLLTSREKARALLLRYGRNSLAWKILNPGMKLWFARGQEGVIGYQRFQGLRVVAGAPVSDIQSLKSVVQEFENNACSQGERVCYFGAESWLKDLLRQSPDHRAVVLGAQPVWNPQRWPAAILRKGSLQSLMQHARRRGVVIEEVSGEKVFSDPGYQECLDQWLQKRKMPEMGFLVDSTLHPDLSGLRFFTAFSGEAVTAFAVIAPVPARGGWLIEHLIRGRNAVKGTSELLIDRVMAKIAAEGAQYATLGLAPLSRCSGISYRLNPGWMRAFFSWLYFKGARLYSFNGLDFFKAKFNPESWEPVYAIVNRSRFSFRTLYRVAGTFCRMPPLLFFFAALGRRALSFWE